MKICFQNIGSIDDHLLKYAVIASENNDGNIFVRQHHRTTWEIPGGRREQGETIEETALRELLEETGALKSSLIPVSEYSVTHEGKTTWGRLFFGRIEELGPLPLMEIAEVKCFEDKPAEWTYPLIQPLLYEKIQEWKRENDNSCTSIFKCNIGS
jgi:8-oxo-dGTP diphosphatase